MITLKNESQRIEISEFLKTPERILNSTPSRGEKEEAFCLLYIKMEQQLRKLVCYLLRTDPHSIHWSHIRAYVSDKKDWDPERWLSCFDSLKGRGKFKSIIDAYEPNFDFRRRRKQLADYRKKRNDIFHGVNVDEDFFKWFNAKDQDRTKFLIQWIKAVAESMDEAIGYDGIQSTKALKNVSRKYLFSESHKYDEVKKYIDSKLGVKSGSISPLGSSFSDSVECDRPSFIP